MRPNYGIPFEWRRVWNWLDGEYTLTEIGEFFALSANELSVRADQELPLDELERFNRRAVANQRKRKDKSPCGTIQGYWRHTRNGEDIDDRCMEAHKHYRERINARKSKKK